MHAEQQQILRKNDSNCGGFGGYEFTDSSGTPKAGRFLLARQTHDIKSSVLIKRRHPSYSLDIGGSVLVARRKTRLGGTEPALERAELCPEI